MSNMIVEAEPLTAAAPVGEVASKPEFAHPAWPTSII